MGLNFSAFQGLDSGIAQGMTFGLQSQRMQMQKAEAAERQKYREVQMEMTKFNAALKMGETLPPAERAAFYAEHADGVGVGDFTKSLFTNYGELALDSQKIFHKGMTDLGKFADDGDWTSFTMKADSLRHNIPPSSLPGFEKTIAGIKKNTLAPAAAANAENATIAQIARQRGGFPGLTPPSYNPGMSVNPYAGGMPGLTPPTGMSDADVLKTPMAGDIRSAANLQKLKLSDKAKENLAFPEWGDERREKVQYERKTKAGAKKIEDLRKARDADRTMLTTLMGKDSSSNPMYSLKDESNDEFFERMANSPTFQQQVEAAIEEGNPLVQALYKDMVEKHFQILGLENPTINLAGGKGKANIGPRLSANKSEAVDTYWAAQFGGK